MPYTLNGIGTHYWGKANLSTRSSFCPHCENYSTLKSYDTTKYVVVFFIPFIPLGKLRILDECASCQRHGAMKAADYQTFRKEALETATTDFRATPHDPEAALAVIDASLMFKEPAALSAVTERLLGHTDPTVLGALADALEQFDQVSLAERAYLSALARAETLDRSPAGPDAGSIEPSGSGHEALLGTLRAALTRFYIQHDRLPDARSLVDAGTADNTVDPAAMLLLAEELQSHGEHAEVVRLLDRYTAARPELAETLDFKELRRDSSTAREGDTLGDGIQRLVPDKPRTGFDWAGLIAGRVWIALLLSIALGVAWGGTRHTIYLVNGLSSPYTILLDGEPVTLPPAAPVEKSLWIAREHTLEAAPDAPPITGSTFRLELPFWQALTGDDLFVVNPDRVAVLLWEKTAYAESESLLKDVELEAEAYSGQTLHRFKEKIHYPFREFPDQIEMSSSTNLTWRHRLDQLRVPAAIGYSYLSAMGQSEQAIAFLEQHMRLGIEDSTLLFTAAEALDVERFRDLAGDRLTVRPLDIQWHRALQQSYERNGRSEEAKAEYDRLLNTHPDDDGLLYLRARLETGGTKGRELLERAISLQGKSPWPYFGLAYTEMAGARWQRALDLINKAAELGLGEQEQYFIRRQAQTGLRAYDALLEEHRALQQNNGFIPSSICEELQLLVLSGRDTAAADRLDQALEERERQGNGAEADKAMDAFLRSCIDLANGDLDGYLARTEHFEDDVSPYFVALLNRDWSAVQAAVAASYIDKTVYFNLLAALEAGPEQATAEPFRRAALEALDTEGTEERLLARLLQHPLTPEAVQDALGLNLQPHDKSVALALIAQGHGRQAEPLRRLAAELNIDMSPGRLILERHIERQGSR